MGLDYGHTCPDIDRGIDQTKTDIENNLDSMIDDCCPLFEGDKKQDFIKGYADAIYDDLEGNFENVRRCNEDIRSEADRQIDKLEDRVSELEAELSEHADKVSQLETELEDAYQNN